MVYSWPQGGPGHHTTDKNSDPAMFQRFLCLFGLLDPMLGPFPMTPLDPRQVNLLSPDSECHSEVGRVTVGFTPLVLSTAWFPPRVQRNSAPTQPTPLILGGCFYIKDMPFHHRINCFPLEVQQSFQTERLFLDLPRRQSPAGMHLHLV